MRARLRSNALLGVRRLKGRSGHENSAPATRPPTLIEPTSATQQQGHGVAFKTRCGDVDLAILVDVPEG